MAFCFRLRFKLSHSERINSDDRHWVLTVDDEDEHVLLFSKSESLKDAQVLIVQGWEYDTEQAALLAGGRWRSRISAAFARIGIGADFGDRAPTGAWTGYGLQQLSEQNGGLPFRNDVHGLAAFEWNPETQFVAADPVDAWVGRHAPTMLRALREAAARDIGMTLKEQLAFDLYSAAGTLLNADAKFVMLMMAVETLIPQTHRSTEALGHLEYLIKQTEEASELTEADRSSLIDSLEWLRYESVGKAGRALASTLGERTYMTDLRGRWPEDPVTFFSACYEMRGKLVHGEYPRPDRGDVSERASQLERFVADLLAKDLLDFDPSAEPTVES